MAQYQFTKFVKAGDWRTLIAGWNNGTYTCRFLNPADAQVKVRYGDGWWFGWDSQKKTLDGVNTKSVKVGGASIVYARVQIKVEYDVEVTFEKIITGPGPEN